MKLQINLKNGNSVYTNAQWDSFLESMKIILSNNNECILSDDIAARLNEISSITEVKNNFSLNKINITEQAAKEWVKQLKNECKLINSSKES